MNNDKIIQVQPFNNNDKAWLSFAEEEGLGFEVIELSLPPALAESGLFESIKEWYKKSCRVTSYHGNFIDINPASGDQKFRELSRERCHESCRTAMELGAQRVVFHCSCFPFLRGLYLDFWLGQCAGFYSELADSYDIDICIENCMDLDPEPIKKLLERLDNRRIGVCLDAGHANYSCETMERWFSELGDRILCMHLSDNNGRFDEHLELGKGTVDWGKVDRLWKSLDREIPLTLEVGPLENVKRSLEYLKLNGFFNL